MVIDSYDYGIGVDTTLVRQIEYYVPVVLHHRVATATNDLGKVPFGFWHKLDRRRPRLFFMDVIYALRLVSVSKARDTRGILENLVTECDGVRQWGREQIEATVEEMGAHGIAALQLAAEYDCTDDTPFNELMTRHSGMQLYELDGQAVNMDEDVLTMLNRVEGYDWDSEKDWPQPVLRLYYIHLLSPRCCCAGALEIGHS